MLASAALREQLEPVTDKLFQRGIRLAFLDRNNQSPPVVERVDPDLLLLYLGEEDDRELNLCRELKRKAELQNLPIIFVTDRSDPHRRVTALRSGAVDILHTGAVALELLPRMESQIMLYRLHNRVSRQLEQQSAELEQARRIQEQAIPQPERLEQLSERFSVEIATHYSPSEQLGGDFFELFELGEDQLGGYLADFSGHGVQAALHTFSLRSFSRELASEAPAEELLLDLNDFYTELLPDEHYLAFNYFRIDPREGLVRVWFQGGPQMYVIPADGGPAKEYHLPNVPIAMRGEIECEELRFEVEGGDTVVLVSDGVLEARGPNSDGTFSKIVLDRLINLNHLSLNDLVSRLITESREYAYPKEIEDDQTVLALRF